MQLLPTRTSWNLVRVFFCIMKVCELTDLTLARRGDVDGIRRLLPQAGGVTVDGLNSRDQVSPL